MADLVDPVPDGPDVPDLSGFERLVDSSYVPPAATQAGDTAEIPRINEEHVPRARSYAMGPTEKELRRRDRQQKKLAKKFSKMQEKEEARKAKELLRAEKERLRAETAAEKERLRAAEAEAREQRRIAEEEAREARRAAEAASGKNASGLSKSGWLPRQQLWPWQPRLPRWKKRLNSRRPARMPLLLRTRPPRLAMRPVSLSVRFLAPSPASQLQMQPQGRRSRRSAVQRGRGSEPVRAVGQASGAHGSHAARPSVNRQGRGRSRKSQDEAGATPETPVVQEAPQASPNESADACAAEETALMEAASAIVVADQAAVTTAEAEEALTPRATGELAFPSTIEEETPELESSIGFSAPEEAARFAMAPMGRLPSQGPPHGPRAPRARSSPPHASPWPWCWRP